MIQNFKIKNRYGLEIVGDIMTPKNPIGTSFVLHGLGGFRAHDGMKSLVETLFDNNYIVVNFDATNSENESGGKYEDATLQKHYEDLEDVIKWAEAEDWYKSPLVLAGHSMGAYAITKYAENYPDKIKGIFPYATVVTGELSFEAHKKAIPEKFENWQSSGWDIRDSVSRPGLVLKLPWSHMVERLNHNLLVNVDKLTMPVLFVVGEFDESCPPEHQQILFRALPKNNKNEMHIVKDAKHTFRSPEHLGELKIIFDNWLKRI